MASWCRRRPASPWAAATARILAFWRSDTGRRRRRSPPAITANRTSGTSGKRTAHPEAASAVARRHGSRSADVVRGAAAHQARAADVRTTLAAMTTQFRATPLSTSSPASRDVTDGIQKAAARAMLRAVGSDRRRLGQAAGRDRLVVERDHAVQHLDPSAHRGRQGGRARRRRRGARVRHDHRVATASRWATRACVRRWSAARSSPTRSSA